MKVWKRSQRTTKQVTNQSFWSTGMGREVTVCKKVQETSTFSCWSVTSKWELVVRSIGNSCLCRSTAKILVLGLGLQEVSRPVVWKANQMKSGWERFTFCAPLDIFFSVADCGELPRVVTPDSLLPSNSCTSFLLHTVLRRRLWEF